MTRQVLHWANNCEGTKVSLLVCWQSLANLCRCRVATWPLSTLNPIWQTSWCVVESFYKMLVYIVTHLCTDRAIKRKESSTPELFQIANGCNQSVGSQEQGYTAAFPLVFIQRQVEEKVPNNQLESLLVKLTAVQVPSPACEPSRPVESVQGEQGVSTAPRELICQ